MQQTERNIQSVPLQTEKKPVSYESFTDTEDDTKVYIPKRSQPVYPDRGVFAGEPEPYRLIPENGFSYERATYVPEEPEEKSNDWLIYD